MTILVELFVIAAMSIAIFLLYSKLKQVNQSFSDNFNEIETDIRSLKAKDLGTNPHLLPASRAYIIALHNSLFKSKILDFVDFKNTDDKSIQILIKHVDASILSQALVNQDEALRNKFYSQMSERAAVMFGEDLEILVGDLNAHYPGMFS